MATIEYNLYLDESGDFDNDLEKAYRNECLVGGYLTMKANNPSEHELEVMLVRAWERSFPEQYSDLSKHEAYNKVCQKIRHATELDITQKPKAMLAILPEVAKSCSCEFIIFENYRKTRIVDSTLTYINILADGIVQLLVRLALKHPDEYVKLNILAGGRRDMIQTDNANQEVVYIKDSDITRRVKERIELLKVQNSIAGSKRFSYNFETGNDKKCTYLIACDYICNFYFTRTNDIFKETVPGTGRTYAESLLDLYKQSNIFSLNGNVERERVIHGISTNNYGGLLFELAVNLITESENKDSVVKAFCMLPAAARKLHLQTLSNYIKEILEVRRNLDLSDKVIRFGLSLNKRMSDEGKEDIRFYMDLILYDLALKNHLGDLDSMEVLFEEGKVVLPELLKYSENIDLAFMFYNRYAVYLFDSFKAVEAFDLLESVIKLFESFEYLGVELSELSFGKEKQTEELILQYSDQLGRLLGTQTMIAGYLLKQKEIDYDSATAISDRALENFDGEKDLIRQNQNRAFIEVISGHVEEGMKCLLKGCCVGSIGEITGRQSDDFEFCHISRFLKYCPENHSAEIKALRKYMKEKKKNWLRSDYPAYITAGNMAETLASDSISSSVTVNKYFETAYTETENELPLHRILKLMLRCSQIQYLFRISSSELTSKIKDARNCGEALLRCELPCHIQSRLKDFIEGDPESIKTYEEFAKLRQY